MTKIQKITYYVLLVLISLGFILAAIPKLMDEPVAAAGFATDHLPVWFMYVIGVAEIAGAIGLWIAKLRKWAAYGLWIILAGAVVTTVIFVNVSTAIIPVVYAMILGIIYWLKSRPAKVQTVDTAPNL
jgi:putative oxidoreductase